MSGLQEKLEQQWAREKRQRRQVTAGLIAVLCLLLFPWHCDEDEAPPHLEKTSRTVTNPPDQPPVNRWLRPEFATRSQKSAAWADELHQSIARSRADIRACIGAGGDVIWTFAFNPSTGILQFNSLQDPSGAALEPALEQCLRPILPGKVVLRATYPNNWTSVRITLSDHIGE